jgi:hypothetical protein
MVFLSNDKWEWLKLMKRMSFENLQSYYHQKTVPNRISLFIMQL